MIKRIVQAVLVFVTGLLWYEPERVHKWVTEILGIRG